MNRSLDSYRGGGSSPGESLQVAGGDLVASQPARSGHSFAPHLGGPGSSLPFSGPKSWSQTQPTVQPPCPAPGRPVCGGDQSGEAWGLRSWEVTDIWEAGPHCPLLGTALHSLTVWGASGPPHSTWTRSKMRRLLPMRGVIMEPQLPAQACRYQTRSLVLWVQLVMAPTLAPTPHLSTKNFWWRVVLWSQASAVGCRGL